MNVKWFFCENEFLLKRQIFPVTWINWRKRVTSVLLSDLGDFPICKIQIQNMQGKIFIVFMRAGFMALAVVQQKVHADKQC